MSRNGSGTYAAPVNSWNPAVAATTISPTDWASILSDLSAALTTSIASDGQTPITGNLPMNTFKHTGAGDASAAGQYLAYAQATASYVVGNYGIGAAPTVSFDISQPSSTQRINSTTATNSAGLQFSLGGTLKAYMGTPGSSDQIINGAVAGDMAYRAQGTRHIWSVDSGSTIAMYLDASRRLGVGKVPTCPVDIGNTNAGGQMLWADGGTATAATYQKVSNQGGNSYLGNSNSVGGGLLSGVGNYALCLPTENSRQLAFGTNNSTRLVIETDGRIWGTGLHNNGSVTGTSNQYIASGSYTPTLTNVGNIPSATPNRATWMRVGNVVTVSGSLTTGTLSAAAATTLGISLPIASNLGSSVDLTGTFIFNINNLGGAQSLLADSVNDRAQMAWTPGGTTSSTICYSFQYEML